ncbi:MAG: hypothetical protein IT287_07730 [Bdellovibrionaceae bacterium]|nr:hypothetical protein [Pseudobdellovibrionaceae bacterium]
MRRFLQTSLLSSMGLVVLLGYQNCTKVKVTPKLIGQQGTLSSEWKDIHAKK